jgi:hypothetical protein
MYIRVLMSPADTPRLVHHLRASHGFEAREVDPHVLGEQPVRDQSAGADAAVARREVRGHHVRTVGVREMPLAAVPVVDHAVRRDERGEPERERDYIDRRRDGRAPEAPERHREVVAEHS